jgi:hypothetical protein
VWVGVEKIMISDLIRCMFFINSSAINSYCYKTRMNTGRLGVTARGRKKDAQSVVGAVGTGGKRFGLVTECFFGSNLELVSDLIICPITKQQPTSGSVVSVLCDQLPLICFSVCEA